AFPSLALFGVKKQYRGQGIGRSMLRIYEGLCREMGFKKCTMLVSKPNVRARRLYQSEGFVKRGEVPGFVFPDVDEYIMIKDL
ncbi:MAG: GNAT family N-acetyltransferase, partial [Lachnospiraceae bacterium]|nr:GNAT family N-acetyltransferase [Lachnospiraceae bacterium]